MQKITPFLWFDNQVEEAVDLYVSLFPNSKDQNITGYGENMPDEKGTAMTMTFQLGGREFMVLNGGPQFPFTEAMLQMNKLAIKTLQAAYEQQ